jgi:hypothetical protein
MEYTFQKHMLTEAERTWLLEALHSTPFDPKVAKVKLLGKLPADFNPNSIDSRLYLNGRITLIGLWHVDPENVLFQAIDGVIKTIRAMIIELPGREFIYSSEVAKSVGLEEKTVERAFYELGQLGHFFSGALSSSDYNSFYRLELKDEIAYDEYLRYKDMDDLLERVYIATKPRGVSFIGYPQKIETIKHDTAFVLMAMDPDNPELEDVYVAIKEVCHEFSINAYRADEIEHQDRITDLILSEIKTCEYLIADLSHERPNVYYEVGYAHAMNKKPILYRKVGTRLHFDLSVHNVPEYKNVTELRELLRRRLEAILGRQPKVT